MSQVTIYLESDLQEQVKTTAQKSGASLSKWISSLIKKELDSNWPQSIRSLSGTWGDFPSIKQIKTCKGTDIPRLKL